MERDIPKTGEIYRHFKNKLYQIVAIAKHSETKENLVIYQALYDDFSVYARPLTMFMSEVDHVKYPMVTDTYRFTKIDKSSLGKQSLTSDNSGVVESNAMKVEEKSVTSDVKATGEGEVSADLLAFLEADTYEDKKKELVFMRPRLTDELINSMAASLDIIVDDGEIDVRYTSLLNAINMLQKFEITNRF